MNICKYVLETVTILVLIISCNSKKLTPVEPQDLQQKENENNKVDSNQKEEVPESFKKMMEKTMNFEGANAPIRPTPKEKVIPKSDCLENFPSKKFWDYSRAYVAQAKNCEEAKTRVESCLTAGLGDLYFYRVATTICEKSFIEKLTETEKEAYKKEQLMCNKKYENEQGTMWESQKGLCRFEVVYKYYEANL